LPQPLAQRCGDHQFGRRDTGLYQRYLTVLEIGGSHAHRFKGLVSQLGLTTLVITDLDAINQDGQSVQPARGQNQRTANETPKTWLPKLSTVDELIDLPENQKSFGEAEHFAIRVAYQRPVSVAITAGESPVESLARTFEDSLVFENLSYFHNADDAVGAIAKFRSAILESADPATLGEAMFLILKKISKASFALDLLFSKEPAELYVPAYLADGLAWLEKQLRRKDQEIPDGARSGLRLDDFHICKPLRGIM